MRTLPEMIYQSSENWSTMFASQKPATQLCEADDLSSFCKITMPMASAVILSLQS